jgi:hypothetical protein
MKIKIKEYCDILKNQLLELYSFNKWSSAEKTELLYQAFTNSHSLISTWIYGKMVGIANAISDRFLIFYYPHLLVHQNYQRKRIGTKIMEVCKKTTVTISKW